MYIDMFNPTEIALGMKNGIGNIYKYGENSVIVPAEAPIWDKGGPYYWHPFAVPAVKLMVVSSAADVDQVTGAWSVNIWGLDNDWKFQTENIKLNGLVPVESIKFYRRSFRAFILDGSARSGALGNITVYETGVPANIVTYIKQGDNQTHMVIYTVPAGFAMLVDNADANVGKGQDATIKLKTMPNITGNEVELTKATRHLYENSFTRAYKTPRYIDEKTDIWMSGQTSAGSVLASASFEGRLFDKSIYKSIGGIIVPIAV